MSVRRDVAKKYKDAYLNYALLSRVFNAVERVHGNTTKHIYVSNMPLVCFINTKLYPV